MAIQVMMSRARYTLIVGQGRSGTNWLLELMDLSPDTFCRNEPYGTGGSPFADIAGDRFVVRDDPTSLEEHWDAVVEWTALHMGERDPRIVMPKHYLHGPSRKLGVYRAVRSKRLRARLALVAPSLNRGEWSLPRFLGSRKRLAEAVPILKLVAPPGWAVFVLRHRPGIPVYSIVRHPGGFLNSWLTRYVAKNEKSKVKQANRSRLESIAAVDRRWAEKFGDIASMSVEESELHYWLYANTMIFEAGRDSDSYHHIVYEELVEKPVPIMRRLYAASGIPWSVSVERGVVASGARSGAIARAWFQRLDARQLELVERFHAAARDFYPAAAGAP